MQKLGGFLTETGLATGDGRAESSGRWRWNLPDKI